MRQGSHNDANDTVRATIAGVIGNVLEWYDFAIFGYFAPVIGANFFPNNSQAGSLLSAYAVFATAYFVRPVGGVLFGYLGDRKGRKTALLWSVLLMAVPTTLIGTLPTALSIGSAATASLVVLRLMQGLSVGGEYVGSIAYVTELAPHNRRGFFGSLTPCASTAGVAMGSLVAFFIHDRLDAPAMQAWGWRLPFLAGFVIGGVALWMRQGLPETPDFEEVRQSGAIVENPVVDVIMAMPTRILHVLALVMFSGGGFYMLFVWFPTFLTQLVNPPIPHAFAVNTISMLVLTVLIPLSGTLSDGIGRTPLLIATSAAAALLAYPLIVLAKHGSFGCALAAQLVFAALLAGYSGPIAATMVEMFPARTRFCGIAVSYNLSLSVFGGTAPFVSTYLIMHTGNIAAAAWYLAFLAMTSFAASAAISLRAVTVTT